MMGGLSLRWKLVGTYVVLVLVTGLMSTYLVGYAWRGFNLREREVGYLTQASVAAGLLSARVDEDPALWQNLLVDLASQAGVRMIVTDRLGWVLADSGGDAGLQGSQLARREVTQALGGDKGSTVSRLSGGDRVMYVAVPIYHEARVAGSVFLASDVGDVYSAGRTLEGWMFLTTLAGCGVAAVAGVALSSTVTGSLDRLRRAAGRLERGDFASRVPESGGPEIRDLSRAFNRMARALEEVDSNRRLFAAGAAHELKSPLASIKAMIDSLLSGHTQDEAMYREFLGSIREEADRLTNLSESLLVLARLEQGRAVLRPSRIAVDELVDQASRSMARRAREAGVSIHWEPGGAEAWLDGELVELALVNLLDNAVKYSPRGETVKVDTDRDAGGILIRVADRGPGVDPEDLERIFDRFYRPDRARARGTGGTGLGLALVREVSELHDGWVRAQPGPGGGLQVEMWFPLRP